MLTKSTQMLRSYISLCLQFHSKIKLSNLSTAHMKKFVENFSQIKIFQHNTLSKKHLCSGNLHVKKDINQ